MFRMMKAMILVVVMMAAVVLVVLYQIIHRQIKKHKIAVSTVVGTLSVF